MREFIFEIEDNKLRIRVETTFKERAGVFMSRRIVLGSFAANTNETYETFFKVACCHIGFAEVIGLSWNDVDLDIMTVSFRYSFDRCRNLKTPKTRAGVRGLSMSQYVADALMRYKKAQTLAFEGVTDKDGNPVE